VLDAFPTIARSGRCGPGSTPGPASDTSPSGCTARATTYTHGALTADATKPASNGYLLAVGCPCGVVFERWITPDEADADLLQIARLN